MSVAVITYHRAVGRWEPDARGRLAKAATALYAEQGFEQTTVAEIARKAGLTERTFFRHFAAAVAGALRDRGVPEPAASLAAETGVAVFKVAFARWVSEPGQPDLPGIIRESMAEMRGVLAAG